MIFVACSGFPVPVSRYFEELNAVEISDTELGIPGEGTTRRWLREAPRGAAFTVLAPRIIANSGFAVNQENNAALHEVKRFAEKLNALAVVFVGDSEFGPTRPNRSKIRSYFQSLPEGFPQPVLDLPSWSMEQIESTLKSREISVAFNPLKEEPAQMNALCYVRMPGPSGYRSRYDQESLSKVADYCKTSKSEVTFCVFRNSDRFVNCKNVLAALE
ncbi:MAG: DUF72 domain-containing protein [Deltaproteobacteria bacterium]|nr:DUF72 domain-containing protein [Deltaproteobacteria bacterium]